MGFILSRRPWTRQPPGQWPLDFTNPLLASVAIAFNGLTAPPYAGVKTPNLAIPGSANAFVIAGSLVQKVGTSAGGIGALVDGTHYVELNPATLPSNTTGWTIACLAQPTAAPSGGAVTLGFCESPGSSTFDRSVRYFTPGSTFWSGYLFDGIAQTAQSLVIPQVGRLDAIVVTASSSQLKCYVNQNTPVITATSNSGYTGYVSPEFCIGNASDGTAGNNSAIVPLCLQLNRVWTAAEVRQWIANPWQVFKPRVRTLWSAVTVGGGGGTRPVKMVGEWRGYAGNSGGFAGS